MSSSPLPVRLGKNIANARKALGWTQAVLAERMKREPESISRFERGATLPSLATLEQLAVLLQTSIADLLAEYPGETYSDVQRIAAILNGIEPEARAGVLSAMKTICGLLGKTAR